MDPVERRLAAILAYKAASLLVPGPGLVPESSKNAMQRGFATIRVIPHVAIQLHLRMRGIKPTLSRGPQAFQLSMPSGYRCLRPSGSAVHVVAPLRPPRRRRFWGGRWQASGTFAETGHCSGRRAGASRSGLRWLRASGANSRVPSLFRADPRTESGFAQANSRLLRFWDHSELISEPSARALAHSTN